MEERGEYIVDTYPAACGMRMRWARRNILRRDIIANRDLRTKVNGQRGCVVICCLRYGNISIHWSWEPISPPETTGDVGTKHDFFERVVLLKCFVLFWYISSPVMGSLSVSIGSLFRECSVAKYISQNRHPIFHLGILPSSNLALSQHYFEQPEAYRSLSAHRPATYY